MFGIRQTEIGRLLGLLAASVSYGLLNGIVAQVSWPFMLLDVVVSGILFAGLSAMMWNVLRFTLENATEQGRRMLLLLTLGAASLILMLCLESMVMYLVFELQFPRYTSTLPVRILALALLYVIAFLKVENRQAEMKLESAADVETVPSAPSSQQPSVHESLQQVSVKSGQKLVIVQVSDIIFLRADGDYVSINTTGAHYLKEQTMKYFDENLPEDMFVRVHRSYIVNIKAISRIERYGQLQQLELTNGEKIRISPAGYKLLREKLNL